MTQTVGRWVFCKIVVGGESRSLILAKYPDAQVRLEHLSACVEPAHRLFCILRLSRPSLNTIESFSIESKSLAPLTMTRHEECKSVVRSFKPAASGIVG